MTANLKKILSLLLCLVMVAGLFPASALAEARTAARASAGGGIGDIDFPVPSLEPRPFEPGEEIDEDAEEPVDYFATFDEESGINVVVEAPMGALPTLAEVRVQPVDPEAVQDAVEGLMDGGQEILVAMDISFWLDQYEIEPEEPVQVRVAAPELEGATELRLVHLPDAAEPETLELIPDAELAFALGSNEIAFEAESFSVYAVLGKAPAAEEPTADGEASDNLDFSVSWAHAADTTHSYDENGRLIYTPTNNRQSSVKMSIQLKYNADTSESLPAGAVKIVIPFTVFRDWEGGNKVAVDDSGNPLSRPFRMDIPDQIPNDPGAAPTSFYYTVSEDGESVIIQNFREIQGGMTFTLDVNYLVNPSCVGVETVYNEDESLAEYCHFDNTASFDLFINDEKSDEESLDLRLRTKGLEFLWTVTKSQYTNDPYGGTYLTWQDSWGEKPADADDYFYLVWLISFGSYTDANNGHCTQPCILDLLEHDNVVDLGNGETVTIPADECIVGIKTYGDKTSNIDKTYAGIAEEDDSVFTYMNKGYESGGSRLYENYLDENCIVLAKYPKELLSRAAANGVNLEDDGLKITNGMEFQTRWQDGTTRPVQNSERTANAYFRINKAGGSMSFGKALEGSAPATYNGYISKLGKGSRYYFVHDKQDLTMAFTMQLSYGMMSNHQTEEGWVIDPYTVFMNDYRMTYMPSTHPAAASSAVYREIVTSEVQDAVDGDFTIHGLYFDVEEYGAAITPVVDGLVDWKRGDRIQGEAVGSFELYVRLLGSDECTLYGSVTQEEDNSFSFRRAEGFTEGVEEYSNISKTNRLPMPENVVEFTVRHRSCAFTGKTIVHYNVVLHPTEHALAVLGDHENNHPEWPSSYLTNYSRYYFGEGEIAADDPNISWTDEKTATTNRSVLIDTVVTRVQANKSVGSFTNDPSTGLQSCWVTLRINQSVYLPDGYDRSNFEVNNGVFYDLLPLGTYADESSFQVGTSGNSGFGNIVSAEHYTVEIEKNWNNTGRDLVIVRLVDYDRGGWGLPDNYGCVGWFVAVRFRLYNSYDNIRDRGTAVTNAFGFVSTDDESQVFNPYSLITGLNAAEQSAMQSVVDEYGLDLSRMVFGQVVMNFDPIGASQTELTKTASSSVSPTYSKETEAYLGHEYSYRVSFSQPSGTQTSNLVIYDVLETGSDLTEVEPKWQGQFLNVDVSSIAIKPNLSDSSAMCAPVVYYAADVPTTVDLTDSSVWSTTKPEQVKAIAVDCRKDSKGNDFVLAGETTATFYVHMLAPDEESLADLPTVNETNASFNVREESSGIETTGLSTKTYSTVTLLDPMLELHKSSDPASGTQEAPAEAQVGDTVTYTLAVSVGEEAKYALTSVKVEDPIPAGMTVNTSAIRYYTNSSASLQTLGNNKLAQVALRDGTLYFTIPKLEPGVTIYLQIPAKVEALDGTDDYVVYRNQAKITGFNSDSAEIYSEETWHKAFQYFYVYHSSDNTVEKIRLTDPRVTTVSGKRSFNIANETKEGSLYGGYYKAYPAASEGYESAALSYDETGWSKDEGGTPYGGSKELWSLEQAYTADGRSMNPVAGETYYLKEVPEQKYLQPYLHYTYKKPNGEITRAWAISAIDDLNYQQAGFVILDKNNKATICDTLAVTATGNNSTVILKPETVFQRRGVTEGYLDYLQVYDWDGQGNLLQEGGTILQYWVTPDGLMVTGVTSRVVTQITNKNTIARTDTPVKSTIGMFSGN